MVISHIHGIGEVLQCPIQLRVINETGFARVVYVPIPRIKRYVDASISLFYMRLDLSDITIYFVFVL